MPTKEDLMGFGMSPFAADDLGNTPQSLAGAGTTQATAAAIRSSLVLVTSSGGADRAILPSDAKIGSPYFVASLGATASIIYCPVGHTLNGVTNGAATFQATPGMAIFMRTSATAWVVTPTTSATVTVA